MAKKNINDLRKEYEDKLQSGKSVYLDADDFGALAEYYDEQDEIDSAREIIDYGLSIHPENSSLQLKKAKFLVYDGEYIKAIRLLEKNSEYDYDLLMLKAECYLQLGMYAEAYIVVKTILENETEELETTLAEIGFLYVEADLFDEAVLYFNKSLEYDSDKTDVLSDLSYAYEMLGDFDAAITTTNKILDIDPYTYDAWVNLGKLYSLQDKFEQAVDAFDFALTINDSDSNILKLKAHCLSLSGKREEAITLFRELLIERPHDSSIYFLLAECYQTLNKPAEAVACLLEYGEAINMPSDEFSETISDSTLDAALNIAKQGLQQHPHSIEFCIIAGDIKFKQRMYDDAENYFIKAYTFDSLNISVIDRLAIVAIKKEEYKSAIGYTKQILTLEPDNSIAKQRLALLFFEEDETSEFEMLLNEFSDEDLHSLFKFIYDKNPPVNLTRKELIDTFYNARECRILFKNISL